MIAPLVLIARTRCRLAAGLAVFPLLLGSAAAPAQNYVVYVEEQGAFDDNRALITDGSDDLVRLFSEVGASISHESAVHEVSLGGAVTYVESFDNSVEADRFNYRADLDATRRFKRTGVQFSTRFSERSSRDSEFNDSTLVVLDASRRDINVDFRVDHRATRKVTVFGTGSYQNSRITTDFLSDFDLFAGSLGADIELSPRDQLTVSGRYVRLDSELPLVGDSTTDGVSLNARYEREITDRWTFRVSAGGIFTAVDDEEALTYLVGGSLRYRGRRLGAEIAGSRQLLPSANATLRLVDAAGLSARYRLTRSLTAIGRIDYRETELITFGVAFDQLDARAELEWDFARRWRANARYVRRAQGPSLFGDDTASGNSIFISLRYTFESE